MQRIPIAFFIHNSNNNQNIIQIFIITKKKKIIDVLVTVNEQI